MWRARTADGTAAEKSAAEIRAAAARPADDAARRPLERRVARPEHSRLVQHTQRLHAAVDVELIARCTVEGAATIRADLGGDAELP